jgi:hypothetical protein
MDVGVRPRENGGNPAGFLFPKWALRASSFPRDSIRTEITDTIEKINIDNIETRIYSGSRTNLLIMISTTRNKEAD